MYKKAKAADIPNLAANIIGGISFTQLSFPSAIHKNTPAIPQTANIDVKLFLGPKAFLSGAEITVATASATELTIVFVKTSPGMYFMLKVIK